MILNVHKTIIEYLVAMWLERRVYRYDIQSNIQNQFVCVWVRFKTPCCDSAIQHITL